jgi:hypothetical protein
VGYEEYEYGGMYHIYYYLNVTTYLRPYMHKVRYGSSAVKYCRLLVVGRWGELTTSLFQ